MTRKPTLAQRFAGFLALTALGFVHGWLVWIMFNAMVNDVAPESILDIGLFVWGMVLLQIVFAVAGVVALFLALAALGWVAWAVAERDRP
jgi:small-conductance mechanosensitive channel